MTEELERQLTDLMEMQEGRSHDVKTLRAALPEELREYVTKMGGSLDFPCFRHPLYYAVPYFGSKFEREALLSCIEQKCKRVEEARADGDISTVINMHERPYRLEALSNFVSESPEQFYPVMGEVWTGSENIWQNLDMWKMLWHQADHLGHTRLTMDEKDLEFLSVVQKAGTVEIYRGAEPRRNVRGLSWTTDRKKAEWFSRRFRAGHTYQVTVGVQDIIAAFVGLGESEVILRPRRLKNLKANEIRQLS